jgi:hypothetical protein
MSADESYLDLRLLGADLDDNEARSVADEIYAHLNKFGCDLEGVAPVLRDVETAGDEEPVERIEVQPNTSQSALVVLDGSTHLVVDKALVDHADNLSLYRDHSFVAHVGVAGVPLEVPRYVRRAIEDGETGVWE